MKQELLTVAQFKERYQISHTAFYRQRAAGRLRTIKIGASTRIRLADAEAWLASLSGGAA
jgi:predicted DNA-binding transcriptional regulator AlpA